MSREIDWQDLPSDDQLLRFGFESGLVRGVIVSLDEQWKKATANQDYPPAVQQLLGEAVAAGLALVASIKFEGQLILQVRGSGPVPLFVVQVRSDLSFRLTAQWTEVAETLPLGQSMEQLVGEGHLVMTLEPDQGQRYQSVVPLEGLRLAHAIEGYFRQSEQLATRMVLAADPNRAVALLVQQMPGEGGSAVEQGANAAVEAFEHLEMLVSTLDTASGETEMLEASAPVLLHRLFHQEQARLLDMAEVRFFCGCSRTAVAQMLRPLGRDELLAAQRDSEIDNVVAVRCEFCGTPYHFDAVDIEQLLADDSIEPPGKTQH